MEASIQELPATEIDPFSQAGSSAQHLRILETKNGKKSRRIAMDVHWMLLEALSLHREWSPLVGQITTYHNRHSFMAFF